MTRRVCGLLLLVFGLLTAAGDAAPRWGWLGVRIRDLSEQEMEEISKRHGLREGFGALIVDVIKETPAEASGLMSGDLVVAFRDRPVVDTRALQRYVATASVGETVTLTVLRRDEGRRPVTVRLGPDAGQCRGRARGRGVRVLRARPGGAAGGRRLPAVRGPARHRGRSCPGAAPMPRGSRRGRAGRDRRPAPWTTLGAVRDALKAVAPDGPLSLLVERDQQRVASRSSGQRRSEARPRRLMIVLGINETHCATAALLADGRIVGCASEERFTRLKNDAGYPRLAIDALLAELRLAPADIDLVALAGARAASREWLNRVLHDEAYAREYYGVSLAVAAARSSRSGCASSARVRPDRRVAREVRHLPARAARPRDRRTWACPRAASSASITTLPRRRRLLRLRLARRPASALVLTNDNSGDGLCATASTGRGARPRPPRGDAERAGLSRRLLLVRHAPARHEVRRARVQGDGPGALRAGARYAERAEAALREVFDLEEGQPARFRWREPGERYQLLLRATLGLRFDGIAGGAQRLLEDVLLRWARLMRERYGGARLALGGGVFMNVKANMLIAGEEWVEDLFAFPSCGDESNAVGAAYLGYLRGVRGAAA